MENCHLKLDQPVARVAVPSENRNVDSPRPTARFNKTRLFKRGCLPLEARRSGSGFTLIELMMVILLVAVLLGIAAPSFQGSLQRNRLQSTVSDVATALSFARAEAVIRSEPVAMCPTIDTASCSGSNWETGWLLFVDNGTGSGGAPLDGTLNGNEELLRIGSPGPAGVTIRTVNFPATSAIVFQDSGRVLQNVSGTVTVCDARGANEARGIIVEVSGQGRLAVDIDANGVDEDDTGTPLACP